VAAQTAAEAAEQAMADAEDAMHRVTYEVAHAVRVSDAAAESPSA
jgi:hypothetical protein